ncbi:MAG: uracil-DNA glycosylase [Balneolaceae bacterium]|nr:uracil-DNA glycosylase [Balneolaceae bacterium]
MKSPQELIDGIIRFIENEREVYGDFAASAPSPAAPENTAADTDTASDSGEKSGDADPADTPDDSASDADLAGAASSGSAPGVTRSTRSSTGGTRRRSSSGGALDPQEGLFEEDASRDVYQSIGRCSSLGELRQLCAQAEVLRTDLPDTNMVFGVGNAEADLMLIGEAPGAEEDKQGEPFVGAAGQLLNKILAAIDFEREDVYIANILKHRPPNNRNPLPEERERSLPFLLKQIELIQPKLILCLGKTAAQTLLENNDSLSSMRGTFHSYRGRYELLATYHPAALLRHEKWKRPTWEDVQKLRRRYDELGGKP